MPTNGTKQYRQMKHKSLKEKAIAYRKQGYSYGLISEKTGLAKSTLSNWLKEIPYEPNRETEKRMNLGKLKIARIKNKEKIKTTKKIKKEAKKEVGLLTKRDLWFLGLGLYMGEGSKIYERTRLINSDPKTIKLSMKWFRETCKIKDKHFFLTVHAYPDNNIKETINYWSRITGISKRQFGKTQIDKRRNKSNKKRRKLPYGTLHLQINSCGKKELGVNLHRKIMGWIEGTLNQI